LGRIEGQRLDRHSKLPGQLFGPIDISALGRFVPTDEQEDQNRPAAREVHPIAGPIVDAKFADSVEELCVSEQPRLKANDPLRHALPNPLVGQLLEPVAEFGRLPNFKYVTYNSQK
jgi:hypothetical protein